MNQHLLVKMPERRTRSAGPVQLGTPHRCVACRDAGEGREQDAVSFANLGKAHNTRSAHGASFSQSKAGPMSGAQPMSDANALAAAIALGLTSDWRLDLDRSGAPGPALRHFPYAAE
jgi:hypothetical protein